MRGVSDGSEVFQNGERRSQTFRLRLKHRKMALATDQHVPVKRGHQNHSHTLRLTILLDVQALSQQKALIIWCDAMWQEKKRLKIPK